jgi:hypothetical protein
MKNGTITFLCDAPELSRQVIDVKITDSLPLIALSSTLRLIGRDGSWEDLSGYQHLSIPGDLRVHLTPKKGVGLRYRFLKSILDQPTAARAGVTRAFTYVSPVIEQCRAMPHGRWEGGSAIISPLPDAGYSPALTRLFVDFLVHRDLNRPELTDAPFALQGMRPAPDRTDYRLGPFEFRTLHRKQMSLDVFFTLRWGYWELEAFDGACVVQPDGLTSSR